MRGGKRPFLDPVAWWAEMPASILLERVPRFQADTLANGLFFFFVFFFFPSRSLLLPGTEYLSGYGVLLVLSLTVQY